MAALTPEEYQVLNRGLYAGFMALELISKADKLMLYYSVRNEVNTVALIRELLKLGKTVALPVCAPGRDLQAAVIHDLSELRAARFGLMEPGPKAPLLEKDQLELVVTPGLAFDERGYRLGHGAGYYDRFLAGIPSVFKLGLAYDFQLIPRIPVESHDIRLDALLTPSKYLSFT